MTNLIYATTNPGKIVEIGRHFGMYGIKASSLIDFVPLEMDVAETGKTLGENAILKSRAYAKVIAEASNLRGQKFLVVSDDTGVEIKGLNGEPGIFVRRWKGYKMTDEEIISYTLERMEGLKGEDRNAKFRTVLAITTVDEKGKVSEPVLFEGSLDGWINETATDERILGFPFESIFQVAEWDIILGDLHRMPLEKKKRGFFNHRERAIEKAIPFIKKEMK